MPDAKNPYLGLDDFENNPVIAYPELPVAFQGLSQRLPIVIRCVLQTLFYGLSDSVFCSFVDKGQILDANIRMIVQRKRHGSFPNIFMRKRLFFVEGLHSCIGKGSEVDIFPQVYCLSDQVAGKGGHGNAFAGCKVMQSAV
jgi:hypothetical protein